MQTFFETSQFSNKKQAFLKLKHWGLINTTFHMTMLRLVCNHSSPIELAKAFILFFEDEQLVNLIAPYGIDELHPDRLIYKDKILFINKVLSYLARCEYPLVGLEDCFNSRFIPFGEDDLPVENLMTGFKHSAAHFEAIDILHTEGFKRANWYFLARQMILTHQNPKEIAAVLIFLKKNSGQYFWQWGFKNEFKRNYEKLFKLIYTHSHPFRFVASYIVLNLLSGSRTVIEPLRSSEEVSPRSHAAALCFREAKEILKDGMVIKINRSVRYSALWTAFIFHTPFPLELSLMLFKLMELDAWHEIKPFDAILEIRMHLLFWLENPEFITLFLQLPNEATSIGVFKEIIAKSNAFKSLGAEANEEKHHRCLTDICHQLRDHVQRTHFFLDDEKRPYQALLLLSFLEMQWQGIQRLTQFVPSPDKQLYDFSLLKMEDFEGLAPRK